MISVKNLSVSFSGKVIIDDISFQVNQGETLAIMGKNGSGKSVLLKTIAGLIRDYPGEIKINGRNIKELFNRNKKTDNKKLQHCEMAYVFQKGGLFDSINVFDNTAFGLRRMGIPEEEVNERVSSAIERVGLKGADSKLPSELSGGMQKRVGLARAVCMQPDVILYDDPTAGLDPILSDSIADLLLEIKSSLSTASIVVTNDLKVAKKTADRIALLYSGKFVCYMETEEFFREIDQYSKQFIRGEIEGPIDVL
ncbi:MAG TPA: ATP-binding cassette domain-containing protein [Spirochaetota bacterium]|nr:ATP-binding cassette domain-containing protein [Spirochaetota bacterium]HPS85905.1 ATP-binding cassette domain-containing protein [Spirochaetota bacterium]